MNKIQQVIFDALRQNGVRSDLASVISHRAVAEWSETDTALYGTINRDNWSELVMATEYNGTR